MNENMIKTVKIIETIEECPGVKTITFKTDGNPRPGQFIMVWVPGVDEIPMSVSGFREDGIWSITVKEVGECTEALYNLKVGDLIGVRGPFGNYFNLPEDNAIVPFLIGGGVGSAPLKFLASELEKHEIKSILIEGAREKQELLYVQELGNLQNSLTKIFFCTDDGSYGESGTASEVFIEIFEVFSKENDVKIEVFTCGPEKMMYRIFEYCEKIKIPVQASLERIMRCGCGLCGLCSLDPLGLLVCKDGPVFDSKILRNLEDFGKYKRDFTGKKIEI